MREITEPADRSNRLQGRFLGEPQMIPQSKQTLITNFELLIEELLRRTEGDQASRPLEFYAARHAVYRVHKRGVHHLFTARSAAGSRVGKRLD